MVRKLHAFTGETVNVWSQKFRLAVAGKVAVSSIIKEDVNNVRLRGRFGPCPCRSDGETSEEKKGKGRAHVISIYDRSGSFIQEFLRQEAKEGLLDGCVSPVTSQEL